MLNLVCGFFTPDAVSSLDNRLATTDTEVGEVKTALQTTERHLMALVPEATCSLCTSSPASLPPGAHPALSHAPSLETQYVASAIPGNVGLHHNRPEDLSRLRLNRPPSIRPPLSLSYLATPWMRPRGTPPLLNRAEGVKSRPTIPSSSGSPSGHPHQPSSIPRTSGTLGLSGAAYTPTPSTVAKYSDPISGPVGPSSTPSFRRPIPDSRLQGLLWTPSHTTNFPVDQHRVGSSPPLSPADENNISGPDP